jgi:hypothetical protein
MPCGARYPGSTGADTRRVAGTAAGHSTAVREMNPKDPSTLYSEGPVADEPPDDDVSETSPVPDSGGVGPGPDDLD